MKNNLSFILLLLFGVLHAFAQSVDINGRINGTDEVDGIHIINKTANRFTVSNSKGEFIIPAKLNDTILFSGISYQTKEIIITKFIMASQQLYVHLEELVNALDEVVVGTILTGDLSSDLANSGVERNINFHDLGIPGYTGKPKSQSERRLYTAGDFKPIHLLGLLAGSLELDPIFNAISGRTKLLKNRVHLENQDKCILKIKSNLSEILFSVHTLEEHYKNEFFYFCADDAQFDTICIINNDFKTLEFLKEKLVSFKSNFQTEAQE